MSWNEKEWKQKRRKAMAPSLEDYRQEMMELAAEAEVAMREIREEEIAEENEQAAKEAQQLPMDNWECNRCQRQCNRR